MIKMRKILKGDVAPFEGVILSTEEYNQLYTKQQVENAVCKVVAKWKKETLNPDYDLDETNSIQANNSPVSVEGI